VITKVSRCRSPSDSGVLMVHHVCFAQRATGLPNSGDLLVRQMHDMVWENAGRLVASFVVPKPT
jgi:hypothetical protein